MPHTTLREIDPTDTETRNEAGSTDTAPATDPARRRGTITLDGRRLVSGAVGLLAVGAIGFGGWMLHDKTNELDAMRADADARAHAEQVALDYATAAAEMDFRDLNTWKQRLTDGTTPELAERLNRAATSMEQIVVPLQWTSTAEPITAKATTGPDGTYSVDCFVSVFTSNAQAPDGIQSTATYVLKLDSANDWTITEISGVGPDLGSGEAPK